MTRHLPGACRYKESTSKTCFEQLPNNCTLLSAYSWSYRKKVYFNTGTPEKMTSDPAHRDGNFGIRKELLRQDGQKLQQNRDHGGVLPISVDQPFDRSRPGGQL
jgi:hypothetical protein